ncbi:type IV pilus modification PilV family protein [Oceanobacillus kapialis]|uniref:Prepilin-type N-terminal cleavage/methylation domain-containing protein n=2 Tax=Bacillati TaxID=1783272 RepID=A0ABW5PWX2_9BACI
MNFRQLNNEKGITLVELLAALGLFAIVITLSSSIFMQLFGSEKEANADISLKQQANVLVNEMKNQFYNNEDNKVCVVNTHMGTNVTTRLRHKVNNNTKEYMQDNGCYEVYKSQPIFVQLTLSNNSNNSYTIETTWDKKNKLTVNLPTEDQGGDDNDELDELDETENDEDDYSPPETNKDCVFNGDTILSQGQFGDWNFCPNPHIKNGSAWFTNRTSIFDPINFTIDQNLFADQSLELEQKAKMNVINSARLGGQAIIKSYSELTIGKHLLAKGDITLQENTTTKIGKSARFVKGLKLTREATLDIGNNLYLLGNLTMHNNTNIKVDNNGEILRDLTLTSNGSLRFGGDFTASGNITMHNSASIHGAKDGTFLKDINITSGALHFDRNFDLTGSLTMQSGGRVLTGGNANFSSKVTLNSGAFLHIKGDAHFYNDLHLQSGAKLIVEGSATFDKAITPENGAGSICIKGDANIKQTPDSDIKITEQASSCGI